MTTCKGSSDPEEHPPAVTDLLKAWQRGEAAAADELMLAVYEDLRRIARAKLLAEPAGLTLETADLIQEAVIRLIGQERISWQDRAHFFALAATLMRRILVDHARGRLAAKRAHYSVSLSAAGEDAAAPPEVEVLDLDRALERLGEDFPRHARVVELRYFGGLALPEIAAVLEVSDRTVRRDWEFARAYLLRELQFDGKPR